VCVCVSECKKEDRPHMCVGETERRD